MVKSISWRKLVQKLRLVDYDGPYSGGKHLFMVRGALKLHIPNPHRGDISQHLIAEILRQAGIKSSEWNDV